MSIESQPTADEPSSAEAGPEALGSARYETKPVRLTGDEASDKLILTRRAELTEVMDRKTPSSAHVGMYTQVMARVERKEANDPESDNRPIPLEMHSEAAKERTRRVVNSLLKDKGGASLTNLIERTVEYPDQERQAMVSELGARMLQVVGPEVTETGAEAWRDIDPERQHMIRNAEMLLMAGEMAQVHEHIGDGSDMQVDTETIVKQYNRMVRYARNQDVPDRFRVMLLDCSQYILNHNPRLATAADRGSKSFAVRPAETEERQLRDRAHAKFEAAITAGTRVRTAENVFLIQESDLIEQTVERSLARPPVIAKPAGAPVPKTRTERTRVRQDEGRQHRRGLEQENPEAFGELEKWHHLKVQPAKEKWVSKAMSHVEVADPARERRRLRLFKNMRGELDHKRMPNREIGESMKRGLVGIANRVRVCGWPLGSGARRKMEQARADLSLTLRDAGRTAAELSVKERAMLGQLAGRLEEITISTGGSLETPGGESEIIETMPLDALFDPVSVEDLTAAGDIERAAGAQVVPEGRHEMLRPKSGREARDQLHLLRLAKVENPTMHRAAQNLADQQEHEVDPMGDPAVAAVVEQNPVLVGEPDGAGREKRRQKMASIVLFELDYRDRLAEGGFSNRPLIAFDRLYNRTVVCRWPFGRGAERKMQQARLDLRSSLVTGAKATGDPAERAKLYQLAIALQETTGQEESWDESAGYIELHSRPSARASDAEPPMPLADDYKPLVASDADRWKTRN